MVDTSSVPVTPSNDDVAFMDIEASDGLNKQRPTYKVDQEYTLSWSNLSYTVKPRSGDDIRILKGVTGRAAPGECMAVMGPSGCGKTTLLDILADRISSGVIEGDITLNGSARKSKVFRSATSYVAQEESLMGSFTVYETLMYAAKLTLPDSLSAEDRAERVEDAIDDMGLHSCRHTLVGDMFRKGISGGQKRRLSIAVELISRPSILILDEPTSGLDSASTYNVIEYIRHLSRQGRTVLCTIHQPPASVYNMFDSVTFMVKGETVYSGPTPRALEYFQEQGFSCPQFANPADFILEKINTDFPGHADVPKIIGAYKHSQCLSKIKQDIESDRSMGGVDTSKMEMLTPSAVSQFVTLFHRTMLNNIRNPGIFWVRLVMYIMLSFMVGTMYLRTNDDITEQDLIPLLFYVQAFLVFMSVAVLPFFIEQRGVFGRERANSSLRVSSYVVSNFLAALPGIFLISILSTVLVVLLADLNSFGWFLLNLFLSLVVAESLMHVIGAAVPHYIIGIALGAGLFGMFMLCEGFMVPKDSIPDYWIWCYYLAFHSYSFRSFMYGQFGHLDTTEAKAIVARFQLEDVSIPTDMIILVSYAIVLQLIFTFILYKFHTGRR